ncbi:hypothetical protein QM012_002588 [Aureobasidium pullulans]|uniref:Zn(2)-C6 fungal-type domain-containing protein n=1 Tax=Aureobasidium pullulans TaxID=5580 RepID=A0ABR0TAF0_AURPU
MAKKGNSKRTVKGRSMQGCLTCKDRHIKCNEGRPVCQDCIKVNKECIQRDGSRALPSSTGCDLTAVNTPNTTPAESQQENATVKSLRVVTGNDNTSESAKAANAASITISESLGKHKEGETVSTDHDHNINKLVRSIKNLRHPQAAIMNEDTTPRSKPAAPATGKDENVLESTTISKPSDTKMNNKTPLQPPSSTQFVSTLSLASTTTNRPPPANFTPLKPITHWVPPRPTIIARTEPSDTEKAELRAEQAARKTEKEAAKQQKEEENEMLVAKALETDMLTRAQRLGGCRDCPFRICGESAAACRCKPYLMEDLN